MKVLQVSEIDLVGRRFNGFDLHKLLMQRGVESQYYVWNKKSGDVNTRRLPDSLPLRIIGKVANRIERAISVQSLLFPNPWVLMADDRFRKSDVTHYHLMHNSYFSIAALPALSRMKPSIWTLHDPWAITGHCIHPYNCRKWMTGCGKCPRIDRPIAMRSDRTAFMWKAKRYFYGRSDIDIVVASKWMLDMANSSPLLSKFRKHMIPFGVDLEVFRPTDSDEAKKQMGVVPGSLVVCFRAVKTEFKGFNFIKESLRRLKTNQPVCLLTFNERGLMDEFRGKYQVIDLGWVNDEKVMANAYNASDIFLMPSTAEAFGMMAIEAMACGKPVIVFDGTSLPEVVFAPQGGIAVPQGDTDALLAALERLANNPVERLEIGVSALALARQHYDFKSHAEKMLCLYDEVVKRRACER